jgi:hypothetical protein
MLCTQCWGNNDVVKEVLVILRVNSEILLSGFNRGVES